MKEAARQGLLGLGSKPLDSDHISQHLQDFGLDPEFSTHSRMRGLSGAPLQRRHGQSLQLTICPLRSQLSLPFSSAHLC